MIFREVMRHVAAFPAHMNAQQRAMIMSNAMAQLPPEV